MNEQLPFRLPYREAMGAADFFISNSNREAITWLDRWPDWPHYGLALLGPEGSGKTHLAHVWQKRSAAQFASTQHPPEQRGNFVLDFSHRLPENQSEEIELFHFLNSCQQNKCTFIILSREAPSRWKIQLPDLASRLSPIPIVKIGEPDDSLLCSILAKHFSDRQLPVLDEVIAYLVKRIDRSFSAAADIVDQMDHLQLQTKRSFGLGLAREIMGSLGKD